LYLHVPTLRWYGSDRPFHMHGMKWMNYLKINGEDSTAEMTPDVIQRRVYILTDLYEPQLR
jgi:hypothetical protein